MDQDNVKKDKLDTDIDCDDEDLNIDFSSIPVSSSKDSTVHCVDELIREIVATFENRNESEERSKRSKKSQHLLKQLNKPSQVLTRLNKVNVVGYLDEAIDHAKDRSANEDNPGRGQVSMSQASSPNKENEMDKDDSIQLSDEMTKELNIIRKIEQHVSELVNEVLKVFDTDCQILEPQKKYYFCESPESMKQNSLSLRNMKTPDVAKTKPRKILTRRKIVGTGTANESQITSKTRNDVTLMDTGIVSDSSANDLETSKPSTSISAFNTADNSYGLGFHLLGIPPLTYLEDAKLSPISDPEDDLDDPASVDDRQHAMLMPLCDPKDVVIDQTGQSSKNNIAHKVLLQENVEDKSLPHNLNDTMFNVLMDQINSNYMEEVSTPSTNRENVNISKRIDSPVSLDQVKSTSNQCSNLFRNTTLEPYGSPSFEEITGPKQMVIYVKNIADILRLPKQDDREIVHDLTVFTYFIDVIGFLNDHLKKGITTILLEQRQLKRMTSCVYENYVLLNFKRIVNVEINGIDVRVFGKGLLQDLKKLRIMTSLLFREYNLFRLKFLMNSLKFSSIPFEFLIGDSTNSWIVGFAKKAAEKIIDEFKNKADLDDVHRSVVAERKKLVEFSEEFNDHIAAIDQYSQNVNY